MEAQVVRHFLAAFETGTFTGAAERLHLTQQAVSKSISRLENQLGIRLFERDGRRLRPTVFADMLLPHARTIAAETDRFRADLQDMLGERAGQIRIGVGPSAAAGLIAETLENLKPSRKVRFSVSAGIYEHMLDELICGRLDLLVALRQVDRPEVLIREEVLSDIAYVVVAGANHRLAHSGKLTLADIASERWVRGADIGAVEDEFLASFAAAGAPLVHPEIETTSVLFAKAMLQQGTHLSILPELLVLNEINRGHLAVLHVEAPRWTRPLVIATRARAPTPPLVSSIVEQLKRLAG